ncbi:7708_t:CDS:2 [Entrophospora sp. SA101]|nr:7708_t:CDS:2 [Entrophospora sp. SA101]
MESNILSPFNSINNDDTVESESIDITFNKDYIRYIEKQLDKEPITEILSFTRALSSIMVLMCPCPYPYEYYTSKEWCEIMKENPHKININIIPQDLQFDGIYQSWIYGNTKLVIDRPTMPAIESSIIHFMSLEEQVSRLMEDYKKRSSQFTPPRQIQYMREPLTMTQFNKLLK